MEENSIQPDNTGSWDIYQNDNQRYIYGEYCAGRKKRFYENSNCKIIQEVVMFTRMVTKETISMARSQNVPLLNSSFILMADKDDFRKGQRIYLHAVSGA